MTGIFTLFFRDIVFFFFLMIRRPPRSTRTDTLFPYTTLFRSSVVDRHPAERREMMAKTPVTLCLWYDGDAEEAANFYAATFPNSKVGAVHRSPSDNPSGKEGDVLTVDFTILGIPCVGLNSGPAFKPSEAFSFQVHTDTQEETEDRKSTRLH